MQGHFHSLRDFAAFHRALIALVYIVMMLPCSGAPARLTGTARLTRQIANHVEQIKAPNHVAVPIGGLKASLAEDLLEEVVEAAEATDDDETQHCILRFDVVVFGMQTGRYESSTGRAQAPTPFRLRAFSNRGSPSA